MKVLLVEDDADIAAGIGDYLGVHGLEVDFAYTAAQARSRLQAQAFDLVVLDVNLPDQDGLSLCRSLKREHGLRAPVLFLTARGALEDKLGAFDSGAVDYVVKPFAPAELLARARAIVAHVPASGGVGLRAGAYELDLSGHLLRRGDATLPLHATGFALLRRLMEASPGCVPREELCALLWEDGPPGSDPLRMHVYQLRQQLVRRFGEPLIGTVRGVGYRFVAEAPGDAAA
ncbi:hypothetical protein WQ53_09555 [Pseudoxanthomonas suwonensis]|uniref:Two component transcriptional regulator, winged helix family n=1 Tax=Pseudoxanthomonas suwonensis TaxID=314722 RepID=A0A0E3Z3U0_9GAMM|nr:hypothetical protein WQ53_09555 [Pseudoxanthomonas suwonensis]